MENYICSNCGRSTLPKDAQEIIAENARLKMELSRVIASSNKLLHRPPSELTATASSLPMVDGAMEVAPNSEMIGNDSRNELIDLAAAAMDELIMMAEPDSDLWIVNPESGKQVLNHDEYERIHSPFNTQKPTGFVSEASRETMLLCTNTAALIETFLDSYLWSKMFYGMIVEAETLDLVLSNGTNGVNGAMKLMHAEVQLPTPLVPVRKYDFLRFCKEYAKGKWAIVDVPIDYDRNGPCKRLPSGCILEDMADGLSKITWVDHSQYDESAVHEIYRRLVNSGMAFGAHKWVATLKRYCESLSTRMPSIPSDDPIVICPSGNRSLSKLAQRMSGYFWSGVCPSSASKWDILPISNSDMRIMSRLILDPSSENPSIVLSAATSVWMPVSRQRVFYFLRNAGMRGEWDPLCFGGSMQEMIHVPKGEGVGNSVSILRGDNAARNKLYLQDSWTDSSGSMVVYSLISLQSLRLLMNGGDSSSIPLLPSGFSILPDGHSSNNAIVGTSSDGSSSSGSNNNNGGCLLTVGLQMVMPNLQSGRLTNESVDTVNDLIELTIMKIKDALGVE